METENILRNGQSGNFVATGFFLGMSPKGPTFQVSCPKYHEEYGFWSQKLQILGTWTLWVSTDLRQQGSTGSSKDLLGAPRLGPPTATANSGALRGAQDAHRITEQTLRPWGSKYSSRRHLSKARTILLMCRNPHVPDIWVVWTFRERNNIKKLDKHKMRV